MVVEQDDQYRSGPVTGSVIRTLAQYRPFENGGAGMDAAHDDLVSAALASHDGAFLSLELCRRFILDEFKVELELSEVRVARTRLSDRGDAIVDGASKAHGNQTCSHAR